MHHERDPEAINAETRPEIGYEYRDIGVKGIFVSTFWFFTGTTIVIALTYVFFVLLIDLPLRPESKPQTIPQYPNPLLQGSMATKADISNLRRSEDEKLHTYGWVDKNKSVAHVPIETAMQELVKKGIQAAPETPAPSGVTPSEPGPSNSNRGSM